MRRAFTLVEILVVIAIATVLSGLLMTAMAGARRAARAADDTERMRQLSSAVEMYAADAADHLPPAVNAQSWGETMPAGLLRPSLTFGDAIHPYLRDTAILWPSSARARPRLPSGRLDNGFLWDEFAGLRGMTATSMTPGTTILYPEDDEPTTSRRPCARWDGGIKRRTVNACEADTTWWHDETDRAENP